MDLKICQQLITQAFDPGIAHAQFEMASKLVNPSASLEPADRILIYRHCITGAQQRVLQMLYPVCLLILGNACFDTLARDYAWSPRSNCDDLNQYGEGFADMLEEQLQRHPALNELPYLPDLARLEWAWHQSLFRANGPVFDPASLPELVTQHGQQLIPEPAPSLFIFSSPWPVYDIWQSHKQARQTQHFSMPDNTEYFSLYRQDEVIIDKVSAEIFQFLQLAQDELALSSIADKLGKHAEVAFKLLPEMIAKGWICGFRPVCQEA